MKILKYFVCSAVIFLVISCSTSSEFGSGIDKFFQSKRYKETLKERDSLIAVSRQLETDTTRLGNQIKALQKGIKKMNGEYAFLKADYAALDSQHTTLKKNYAALDSQHTTLLNQYTALKNEQFKLKTEYKMYSDSMEKKLSGYSEELRSKSDELNNKSNELITKTSELVSKSHELNNKSNEPTSRYSEMNDKGKVQIQADPHLQELETLVFRQDSLTREIYNAVKKTFAGSNPEELSVKMVNGEIHVLMTNKLLFKTGSLSIEDKGRKALKKLALVLNRYDNVNISIEGHTDSIPTKGPVYKDNWDLSAIRAASVVRLLSDEYDVLPTKLAASGRGEFLPVATNKDVNGRAKNRRIEIVVYPKSDELYQFLEKK